MLLISACALAFGVLLLIPSAGGSFFIILVAAPFFIFAFLQERAAKAFNRKDRALAEALRREFRDLAAHGRRACYAKSDGVRSVVAQGVAESERHFDQQSFGSISGVMASRAKLLGLGYGRGIGRSQISVFGAASRGVSHADYSSSGRIRADLMNDALFAVLDIERGDDSTETLRVLGVSSAAAAQWMTTTMETAARGLGWTSTHAGNAVLKSISELVDALSPRDVQFANDQFMLANRRKTITCLVEGVPAARGVVLLSAAEIGGSGRIECFPHRFAEMLGFAMGRATAAAEAQEGPTPAAYSHLESGQPLMGTVPKPTEWQVPSPKHDGSLGKVPAPEFRREPPDSTRR